MLNPIYGEPHLLGERWGRCKKKKGPSWLSVRCVNSGEGHNIVLSRIIIYFFIIIIVSHDHDGNEVKVPHDLS